MRAGLLTLGIALSVVAGTGCKYDPHPDNGTLRCGSAGECPEGYTCRTTGFCWSSTSSLMGCDGKTVFAANDQLVRSCILRVGCNPFQPTTSISECVTFNTQNALPGQRCNLTSKTCADFERCEGFGSATATMCAGQVGGRCMGMRAINCGGAGEASYFLDCSVAGGTCRTYGGTGANATADCQVVSSCNETDMDYHCSGNFTYTCVAGTGFGNTCGARGYCNQSDGACYFGGSSTCAQDSDICKGQVEEFCSGGNLFQYDCASAGLSCATNTAGIAWCLAPGCTIEAHKACTESCDGSRLTFCYGGLPYTLDCKDYGFSSCEANRSNPSAQLSSYATCIK